MAIEKRNSANLTGSAADDAVAVTTGVPAETPEPGEPVATNVGEDVESQPGRVAQVLARLRQPSAVAARESKAGERTRGLVLLVGGTLVCLLLFLALFTTDSASSRKERKTQPTQGRPENSKLAEDATRSPVPQLSANPAPPEESGELTEKEVLDTMRNRGTPAPPPTDPALTPPPPAQRRTLATVNFDDPALAEAYRRQGLTPPPPRTEVADWSAPVREHQPQSRVAAPTPVTSVDPNEGLRKSSITYVRSSLGAANSGAPGGVDRVLDREPTGLLPAGTAMVARLQHPVSSAAKVPAVAVIEYNYERDGQIVVPAGSKAYGELSQATPQGWVSLKFHTIEFPSGDQERINASAISMERQMLRGQVNGKNTGLRALTRALTGVGTIAAYMVGGRGVSGGIDSSVLLRERLASNVALTGEQQLAMLAYQQNIVITVPARTQFYLVLHEAGVATQRVTPGVGSAGDADKEVREVMQLRNEIREMNRLMQQSMGTVSRTEDR